MNARGSRTWLVIAMLALPVGAFTQNASVVEITLERTSCFGTCPVYSVRILSDGSVEYSGRMYVTVTGSVKSRISRERVDRLVAIAEKAGYFEMKDEYLYSIGPNGERFQATDLPTTTTSFRVGARYKRVVDYFGAPDALRQIELAIDRESGTSKWVRGGP